MKFFRALKIAGVLLILISTARARTVGTTNLVEGNWAGSASVVVATNTAWTAIANDAWLHLSTANQSGTSSTNVVFTFDANPGATRTGTLTVAGQIITITQAGTNYVRAANALTTLGLSFVYPHGIDVDAAGNVYVADSYSQVIFRWTAANDSMGVHISGIIGLNEPTDVAVDKHGNAFISEGFFSSLKKWTAANNNFTTLLTGQYFSDLALDAEGNLFFTDHYGDVIKKWTAASNMVTTVVTSGLNRPSGVALDAAGDLYFADTGNKAIKKWIVANNTVTTLVSNGLVSPRGVAVDGSGNVYITDVIDVEYGQIKVWLAASNTLTTLVSSGLGRSYGVGVDQQRNIYFTDWDRRKLVELQHAFLDPTPKLESRFAGSDTLPAVLPATAKLTGPFKPTSDSGWLTITGCTNGVVHFSFTDNPLAISRTANITLLGQAIPVTQQPAPLIPPLLTDLKILDSGAFQCGFTNNQGATYSVLMTTNLSLPPSNWTVLDTLVGDEFGGYHFVDETATNGGARFYRVSFP